jgi:hypothetical protein
MGDMTHRKRNAVLAVLASGTIGFLGGCVHDSWSYKAVPDVLVSRSENLSGQGPLLLRAESTDARAGIAATQPAPSRQTVLMVSWKHDLGTYRSSVDRTLVVTLDGPLHPGQYWLTPDNAVLVTSSAYSAPMRERVHLAGSIKIEQINARDITAEVAVRETQDVDSTGFIDRPYDPAYRQWPFALAGRRTFAIARANDASLDPSAVKWAGE